MPDDLRPGVAVEVGAAVAVAEHPPVAPGGVEGPEVAGGDPASGLRPPEVNIHVLVADVLGRRRLGMSAGGLSGCAGVRCSGGCGQWWLPGVSGEGVADAGQNVDAVFAHGVDVAADVEAVLGDDLAGESPGDLLLGFGRAQAAFADVVGGPDPGVGDEQ